jgi:hypothetical protein
LYAFLHQETAKASHKAKETDPDQYWQNLTQKDFNGDWSESWKKLGTEKTRGKHWNAVSRDPSWLQPEASQQYV